MRRFFVGFFATIGVLCLVLLVGTLAAGIWLADSFQTDEPLPKRIVLQLDFNGPIDESPLLPELAGLLDEDAPLSMIDYVDALDRAAADDRVTGLFADLSTLSLGLAQAQELRAAVFRFRSAGKTAIAFADSFESGENGPYYLASAFDRIWLQPSGLLGLTGLQLEFPYAAGLLDKLGLRAEFEQRYEYKGAAGAVTENHMPRPVRENMTRVAESLFGQVISGIATARRLGGGSVQAVIDRGPLLATESVSNGLIDSLGYREQARAMLEGESVGVGRYLDGAGGPYDAGTRIALVHLDGAIVRGDSQGLLDRDNAASGPIVAALDDVRTDPDVKALILRVSSPGGSYVASDTIRHAVERVRESGRPVIVSFADVAASGGYFAALGADHIIAHPGTLTGSIGTLGGKVSAEQLLRDWDVNIGRISIGANAGMFSPTEPFTDSQRDRLRRLLDAVYADFTARVAAARRLSADEIDALARGRVWTGEDARRVGLVDAVGGYTEAMQLARNAAGIGPDAPVERMRFPQEEEPWERLIELVRDRDFTASLRVLAGLARHAHILGERLEASGVDLNGSGARIQTRAPALVVQ
ncbi:signal peptide peptidase SppA [Thalassobaculum salexigens]|uniref:signal peptide peptidase SppA n=1 Tax=Thalassobaculum salexigens TaxID=455360 RepID=UPI0003FC643F|nr:signal peptide peptidase SppA [Thalassobaculum salexigens]